MRLVITSDTHMCHDIMIAEMPKGDVFIHCGDISNHGSASEINDFRHWLRELQFKYKVIIAGNHDKWLSQMTVPYLKEAFKEVDAIYLQDEGIELEGKKFYGTPWVPPFGRWWFMVPADERRRRYEAIPEGLDVLITHGPPLDKLDTTWDDRHAGCPILAEIVKKRRPRVNCFGHIHECGGMLLREDQITYINAAQDVRIIDI